MLRAVQVSVTKSAHGSPRLALPILLPLPFIDLLDNIADGMNLKLQCFRNEPNLGFNCVEIPPHQPAIEK